MMRQLREITATCRLAIFGIPARGSMSGATVAGTALVVFLLLGFLAMVNGFERSLEGAGSPDVVVATSRGTPNEIMSRLTLGELRTLENAPGIARRAGDPLVSGEILRVVSATERASGGVGALAMRGMDEAGWWLRSNARLSTGRLFRMGTREIVAGRQASRRFAGFETGSTVRIGSQDWTVVGVFEADGSAIESEVWVDRQTLAALSADGEGLNSARILLSSADALPLIRRYLQAYPNFPVNIEPERQFYASQSRGLVEVVNAIGWPLALIMAAGALIGALNTTYSSIETRAREIATLRAVGFGRSSTFIGVVIEGLLLALAGGILGTAAGLLVWERVSASTLSANMAQTAFRLEVSGTDVLNALIVALAIGLIGAAWPALKAARQPILVGLASSK